MVEKQFYVDLGVLISAIAAVTSIINSGSLRALNIYIIQGFTITQIVWMSLIMITFGILLADFLLGYITISDVQKQSMQILEKAGKVSEAETKSFLKKVTNNATTKAKLEVSSRLKAKKRVNAVNAEGVAETAKESVVNSEIPSPELLWSRVQERLQSVVKIGAIQTSEINTPSSASQPLPVIVGIQAPTTNLQSNKDFGKKKIIITIILIVVAVMVQLINLYVPAFSI